MASDYLVNYLQSFRRRSGLSQAEVAFLLGIQSGAQICRHERAAFYPGLEMALAYEVIYGRLISELFPGLTENVREAIGERAKLLVEQELRSNSKELTAWKRQVLAAIISGDLIN